MDTGGFMKALCWHGKKDVRVEEVPSPEIINDQDAIIRVTATAICGSDVHLYNDLMPEMHSGDILGHEFMGEVVELGSAHKKLKVGDKVVVPFTISCGKCSFCKRKLFSCCELSNPNAEMAKQIMGQSPAGVFGYSHLMGPLAPLIQNCPVPVTCCWFWAAAGSMSKMAATSAVQVNRVALIFPASFVRVSRSFNLKIECSVPHRLTFFARTHHETGLSRLRFKGVRNLKECPCDVFDLVLRMGPSFLGFPCEFLGFFYTHWNSTCLMLLTT